MFVVQIFNEGWGQYDTERVVKLAMTLDDTRLFDAVTGWYDTPVRLHPNPVLIITPFCLA